MKSKLSRYILLVYIIINILMPVSISADTSKVESFEKLSINEGLSNEYITSIFQDSKGYMWIGTIDGLNRYDGERIKIYNCNIYDDNSLSSTYINAIEEDSEGNIWIGTESGLDILDRETDTIIRMKDLENDEFKLGKLKITSLLNSNYEKDIMWVGTENGLMKINTRNSKIKALYHKENDENSLTNSYITDIEEDESGLIWIGVNNGVNIINKDLTIINNENEFFEEKPFIYDIEYDSQGRMWISTKEGIIVCDISDDKNITIWFADEKELKEYSVKDEKLYNKQNFKINQQVKIDNNNNFIMKDSKNNVWISSSNGVARYCLEDKKVTYFNKNINFENSLSSNVINCFYEDFNGTIWIGTDKGINILNSNNQFAYQNKYIDDRYKLHNKDIVSIAQHTGYIWIATKYDGIYIYNENNGDLVEHVYDKLNLNNQYIKGLFEISENYILIVTNKKEIYIDINNFSWKEYVNENTYNSEVNYIYSDENFIWIATTNNFYIHDINTGERKNISKNLVNHEINPGGVRYILPDHRDEKVLWIGGVGIGLVKYHKEDGVIEKYTHDSSNENSLINNDINCMVFDKFENLWIGTNIGLSKFDTKIGKFTYYTTANGLTNNYINSILIDNNDNLWISTNKGLDKFDIDKEKIVNFTKADGISGYQFNLNSSLKTKNGMIIFGNTNGITYFNPDEINDPKKSDNEVVIGDIFIGKNKIIYNSNDIVLEYNDKDLFIEYFLPVYENLNHITYEYMIEGIDSDWIYVDRKACLEIKSLNPGKYTLKIRARDSHGNLTKETSVNIRVKNPIWKTPLAYLIYIIIFLMVVYYIFNYVKILQNLVNYKTMSLKKQLEENKKLSEELINQEKFKNNYFINLSHELRTPINVIFSTLQLVNNLIRNRNITYEKAENYIEIINRNCDNLLKIINDIIDSSKIETGHYKINKNNNDIVYIVEESALSMSKFIEEKGLSLIIDPEIEEKIISCDETEIERCIINLLGNAVKFTPKGGEIRVYIKEFQNNIEITIEDNGIGISKEDQEFIFKRFSQVEGNCSTKVSSSGIGLTLVKYIVALHDGYVKLESELGKGSKFTIGLPDILEDTLCENKNI